MAFPKRFLGFSIGWQDRGKVESEWTGEGDVYTYKSHSFCNTRLRVGSQDGQPFLYCPRCFVRMPRNTNQDTKE